MNVTLKPILIHLKQDLADIYGDRLLHLTLFGSQARGDAEPGSDIDVLVVLEPPVNPGEEIKRTGKTLTHEQLPRLRYNLTTQHNFWRLQFK